MYEEDQDELQLFSLRNMRQTEERRRQMDAHIASDKARIAAFQESMKRSDEISQQMIGILTSFESRLSRLRECVSPINETTQGLKTAQENIEKTMESIDKTIVMFSVAEKVEVVITAGLRHPNQYDAYIAAVEQLTEAQAFFQRNKSFKTSDRAHERLQELLNTAMVECDREFNRLAKENTTSVLPPTLAGPLLEPLPQVESIQGPTVALMKKVGGCAHSCGYTKHLINYRLLRKRVLKKSLSKWFPKGRDRSNSTVLTGMYMKGSHSFILLLHFYLRLLQNEQQMCAWFNDQDNLELIISKAHKKVLDLVDSVPRQKNSLTSLFLLLDVCDTLRQLMPEYSEVLKLCGNKRVEFVQFSQNFSQTATRWLHETEQQILRQPDKLPKTHDGDVHQHTSNTLAFLRQLFEYSALLTVLLRADNAVSTLQAYILNIVRALEQNLENKAKSGASQPLSYLFLLNNHHYMLKNVRNSSLLTVVESDFVQKYTNMIDIERVMYRKFTWDAVLKQVVDDPKAPMEKNLTPAAKKKIKERFKTFNQLLQEITEINQSYVVPDVALRKELRKEAHDHVLPAYSNFFNKYSNLPFSSDKGKYVKFPPPTVAGMVSRFFGSD
eukprot:gnl/Hemi2/3860_TR1354_c0_g1_i1.p1 gnl/Hemi2/3860_TR1354_c0_g1~~gnl/Hemi2/3860_TR1354_c0_g1_i1.p1  ORF type:complete len:611 (-),score=203.37 gnl/Hemi2/3860_TR1354_c0_g1_i1:8-1840(-)